MKIRPKKYRNNLNLSNPTEGLARRLSYAKDILYKAPTLPKPLEYKDIDEAMVKFVDENVRMVINGKEVPTFTLFSNQRFSEYSQTWQHTDEEGNLIMNFKTISRSTDLNKGSHQGNNYNIPGDRRYEIGRRTVLDENGTEHYEIISMKQPYTVDIVYRIGFITDKLEELNKFSMIINDIFKAKQFYIRPNDHYIPLTIDAINDESQHSIEDRKFFSQIITVKALAYIIREGDYRVDMVPRRQVIAMEGFTTKHKPKIEIEEEDVQEEYTEVRLDVKVKYDAYDYKAEFKIDTDMHVDSIEFKNVRNLRTHINGVSYYTEKGFDVKNGDLIRLRIRQVDESQEAMVILHGWIPKKYRVVNGVPEFVYDEVPEIEEIDVE